MSYRIIVNETTSPTKAADELLRKTLAPDGMITLPVDVEDVARQLGIKVKRLPLDPGTDGLLVKDEGEENFTAVVDAYAGTHRARFTLAHEIAHYVRSYQNATEVTGIVEKRDNMSSTSTDENEVWANTFAAALLMPAGVVASLWKDGRPVEDIGGLFNVSLSSLNHRLEYLGLTEA